VVDVRPADISRCAAEMLLAVLAGESQGDGILLSPGFVVGETTGAAPVAVGREAHMNSSSDGAHEELSAIR
jgi:hypothetical protein